MSICSLAPMRSATANLGIYDTADEEAQRIADSVEAALFAVDPYRRGRERRRSARYPYPYPIHLTPLDEQGEPAVLGTFVVIGKHLSAQGLDFYFRLPLPERRVIASLDGGRDGWRGLLLELTWCRFSRHGWYDNGGRFLAEVPSPLQHLDGRAA